MRKSHFIERSLMSAISFLKEAAFSDECANRQGILQTLEPRIRFLSVIGFLVTTVVLKTVALVVFLYLLCLLLALASRIRLGYFLFRTWVFIPLFSLFIAVPALFNAFSPGAAVFRFAFAGQELVITRQGLDGAILFIVRVATSVSLAVLLSLTTRHAELLKALRSFGIPQVLVLTLSMCYRYLNLLAVTVENVCAAIKSRVGVVQGTRLGQKVVAWNIANIFGRTTHMGEEIYQAMLSRGYAGEPRLAGRFKMSLLDVVWLSGATVICSGLLYLGSLA